MLVCCYRFCRPHVLEWNSVKVSYNEFDIFNEGKIGKSFFMKRFYSLIFLPFLTFFFLYVCVFLSLFYVIFSLFKISFWIFPLLSSFFCMFFLSLFLHLWQKCIFFFVKIRAQNDTPVIALIFIIPATIIMERKWSYSKFNWAFAKSFPKWRQMRVGILYSS